MADCFIKRPSPYRAVNTFHLDYKNQSVYAVSDISCWLFSDKNKTHEYTYEKKSRIHLDRLKNKCTSCEGVKNNNTNFGQITGMQEKLDTTCK